MRKTVFLCFVLIASQAWGQKKPAAPASVDVAQKLEKNDALRMKLQSLLPPGTRLEEEGRHFKDLNTFVAAVHVANDLDIPLIELRVAMEGPKPATLSQAIHTLDPNVSAPYEVTRATAEAKKDMELAGELPPSRRGAVAARR